MWENLPPNLIRAIPFKNVGEGGGERKSIQNVLIGGGDDYSKCANRGVQF